MVEMVFWAVYTCVCTFGRIIKNKTVDTVECVIMKKILYEKC